MKKTRLLITLLVMLVAASGYAQDSYREAVKQYLNVDDKFERLKPVISIFKVLFVNDDKVDLDQLSERYLNEQLVDDYLEILISPLQAQNITEADLQEVYSLLSTPQGQTFAAHKAEWENECDSEIMNLMLEAVLDMEPEGEFELEPIQPDADINATYAAKMSKLLDDMSVVSTMIKQLEEPSSDGSEDEMDPKMIDWFKENMPVIALNTAYGILTDKDLDFGQMLFTKESYRKFVDFSNNNDYESNVATLFTKYMDWMKAQGATVKEDPDTVRDVLKALLNG
jgi:hypothetical protein